ncbi:MAG: cupin domain-containing protein [Nitriliruptoraceae bacterium]
MMKVIRADERTRKISERDGRRRVDIITEEMLGTRAIQADVVYNDAGVIGSPHMHPEADHVFMVIRGSGIAYTDDSTAEVGPGDVYFVPRGDYHWFHNTGGELSERLEIWIPAPNETIWRDPDDTCAFVPSGHGVMDGDERR